MGVVTICTCIGFGFIGTRCQTGYYDFYLSGYENGRPSYFGTIMSVEYKVFWDGTQWGFQQTDPSFPEIVFFSTVDTFNICELIGSDWQIGDITNFPAICSILSSLDVVLIDCPSIPCNCYETTITENCDGVEIGYIDCSDNLVTFIGNKNETYSFCSKIVPSVGGCRPPLIFLNKGECINGQCPQPTTTTTTTTTTLPPFVPIPIQPKNECDPLTIFPLGVECFTIQPTFADSYDGVVGLGITGGTPPFTIKWDDGSIAPAKFNLNAGEYTATVVDYYGDFTATTTCVLTGITTTTTTIPETTTQKVYSDYCLIITTTNRSNKIVTTQTSLTQFTYGGSYNGYPSWVSSSPSGLIYWSGGTTNSWIVSGSSSNQFLINNSYTNPNTGEPLPLTNWQLIGTPNPSIQLQSILFTEGTCSSVNTPSFTIDKNDPTCGCDGSITIQANGGTPPYEYSVNGGTTFQQTPIFQNLCGGNYSVYVKDSLGVTSNQQVNLTPSPSPTTYTVALTVTSNTFNINVTPPLPLGTTISLDLQHVSTFTKQPASSPQTYNNVVTVLKNSIPVPSTGSPNVVPTNLTVTGPCSVFGRLKTETTTNWQNIIISSGDIINGTYTNSLSVLTPPFPTCYIPANKFSKILITNISSINGCECCNFVFTNPSYETSGNSAFL